MWPFPARPKVETKPEVEVRLQLLEKRLEEIEFEWTGWYDKYRRLYARLVKREGSEAPAQPTQHSGPVGDQLHLVDEHQLTPEQLAINQEILAMRGGGRGRG